MTLLELLIAVAVFAVLAVLAYGGLNVVMSHSRTANVEAERLANVQRVLARIGADIEQMTNRPVRDAFGDTQNAVLSDFEQAVGSRIEFTRQGRQNPAGKARSSLQRVAYQLRESELIRESWAVLDRAQDSEAYEADMLDGVKRFEVHYIGSSGERTTSWEANPTLQEYLPRAVEVTLELDDWGSITRLYRVAI
jgi:general secretion pathway protein J